MAQGRAWPSSGVGGTLRPSGTAPGPYYCLNLKSDQPYVGELGKLLTDDIPMEFRAVSYAVRWIQYGVNIALRGVPNAPATIKHDGVYGPQTRHKVLFWQQRLPASANVTPWGGIGPDSVKALWGPRLRSIAQDLYTPCFGLIETESMWDPGAIGYIDTTDLGLGQINAGYHPDMTVADRFNIIKTFNYINERLRNSITIFDGDIRTAIASYNLGTGGARQWKAAGSPDVWIPSGSSKERYPNKYVDKILSATR